MYFKAAVLEKKNKLKIHKLKLPTELLKGQILVKISYSSICHTQLQEIDMKRGKDLYLPHCIGHEGVGVVKKIYKGCKKFRSGDKVCLTWVKSKKTVSKGHFYTNDKKKIINSGPVHTLNEYAVIDESRIYRLKNFKNFKNQVLLGCAMPTSFNIFLENKIKKNSKICVFGGGGLGLSFIAIAKYLGYTNINLLEKNNIKRKNIGKKFAVKTFSSIKELNKDDFDVVVENESIARKIAEFRSSKLQIKKNTVAKSNVEEMFAQINKGEATNLPVVIKTDVQGSAEAIENSITKLSTDEVRVNVIYKGVGAITESDVTLAGSGKGFIVGFNVRALPHARDIAKRDGVDIKYYSIIYELIDDVKNLLTGLLKPDISENITGNVEIREVFSISKIGNIAGCMVKDGLISRKSQIRILRDNIVIHKGQISSLKRFKEEVSEVKSGFECGVMLDNYSDIKVGDIIETFEEVSTSRKL